MFDIKNTGDHLLNNHPYFLYFIFYLFIYRSIPVYFQRTIHDDRQYDK